MSEHDHNLDKAGKGKSSKTKDFKPIPKSRAQRLQQARKSPQAVVKVASYAGGKKSVGALLRYINRRGSLEMEDESGFTLTGADEVNEVLDDWAKDFGQQKKTTKGKENRDVMHLILSTPKGSDKKAAEGAVRDFVGKEFSGNHQYLFAIHDDTNNPHAHVIVKTRGHDGKYLRTNKDVFHSWREGFAAECINHGIDVDSSSRLARGIGTRQQPLKLLKTIESLEKKGKKTKAEKKFIDVIQQDFRGVVENGKIELRPWEISAKVISEIERRGFFEEAKKASAEAATATNQAEKKQLEEQAGILESYGKSIPVPKSKRELVLDELMSRAGRKDRQPEKKKDIGR